MRIIAAASTFAALCMAATPVLAQSASTERSRTTSTTTVSEDGRTTRTETRTTTVGGSASIDSEALGQALAGALSDHLNPEEARQRRLAEPARTEDAFGAWSVSDGGSDARDCRFVMGERAGFLGVRPVTAEACPGRLSRMARWRVQGGQLIFYTGIGEEVRRLRFVEGQFVGGGVEMRRN